ncbi:MAG: hypothetical protein RIR26_2128 [Pseudomonadota bacterium]|jgi:protein-arginine deiminase
MNLTAKEVQTWAALCRLCSFTLLLIPLFVLLSCAPSKLKTNTSSHLNSLRQALSITTDENRNGTLDDPPAGRNSWSWSGQGALLLPNLDDDDQDGQADCKDDAVNGVRDQNDLAPVRIAFSPSAALDIEDLTLNLRFPSSSLQEPPAQWFVRRNGTYERAEASVPLGDILSRTQPRVEMAMEACAFASSAWDGFAEVTIEDSNRQVVQKAVLRAAPFLMIPNTQPMEKFFVARDSSGQYGNKKMLLGLPLPLLLNLVKFHVHSTDVWQEMWMQDTMEIGYTEFPQSRMHVVLNAPRGFDTFGKTLLAPDVAYLEVAQPRDGLAEGDAWLDWFGNLEVSPPTKNYPWGRIYYGKNPESGRSLHPDVVSFLEAQELQKPVAIDTGWLFIKHVDEMLTFWPRIGGGFVAVMPSPDEAASLTNESSDEFNSMIQRRLNGIVATASNEGENLFDTFGIEQNQLVTLPLSYDEAEHGAAGRWSNPVNSVVVNKALLYGQTNLPLEVNDAIRQKVRRTGLWPVSVEDSAYQTRLGNVHCATNSMRTIPSGKFWERESRTR